MRGTRFTDEQIIGIFDDPDVLKAPLLLAREEALVPDGQTLTANPFSSSSQYIASPFSGDVIESMNFSVTLLIAQEPKMQRDASRRLLRIHVCYRAA